MKIQHDFKKGGERMRENMSNYKNLSEDDRAKLGRNGYSRVDIEQIDRAIGIIDYRLFEKDADMCTKKGKKVSAKKARTLLGTEEFLSGVGRSTFHWTSVRDLPDGRKIFFDSSKQFK